MRKYTLASPTARDNVDLRDYEETITKAVHQVLPAAKVTVTADGYYVSPSPDPSQARKIGRAICQSKLKKYCVQIPKLFTSIKVEEVMPSEQRKEKRTCGHF